MKKYAIHKVNNVWKTCWKGGKRNRNAGDKLIPHRVDISQRSPEVEQRQRIGDWEDDTVHGFNAHLVTLVKQIIRRSKDEVAEVMIP